MPTSVDLQQLVAKHGTPLQLYDEAGIRNNARALFASFRRCFPRFKQFFAVKALPNPAILRVLLDEGCGLDCSSSTELYIADKLGCGSNTSFTSNYTEKQDLLFGARQQCIMNLDDATLLPDLEDVTREAGEPFPELISFRLNPGVGRSDSSGVSSSNVLAGPDAKFGVERDQIKGAYESAIRAGSTRFGIHMMTGSCVMSDEYWEESLCRMLDTIAELRQSLKIDFEFVNVGGGLGVPYKPDEARVDLDVLAERMRTVFDRKLSEHNMPEPELHMENGRYMTAPFGWLVSHCHVVKRSHGHTFYGLDACMANLMRPGMYGSYHHITVPAREEGAARHEANVVGTLCENNDWFAKQRNLPQAAVGDLFVIHDTGAHSHSMGFNYNGKLRAPELLLRSGERAGEVDIIRYRETIEGQYANCEMPIDLAE